MVQMQRVDVVVIGAGIAGLAAAIALRSRGFSVTVLERQAAPADSPGETLHPGASPIFQQLGVEDAVVQAASGRPTGIVHLDGNTHASGRGSQMQSFGHDDAGPWRGFHIRRSVLTGLLLGKATQLDARVQFACAARLLVGSATTTRRLRVQGAGNFGVEARWLVDASGRSDWSGRHLGIRAQRRGNPLPLRYGYTPTGPSEMANPVFYQSGTGWTWRAALGDGRTAWVRPRLDAQDREGRGADGSWAISTVLAKDWVLRIGDCACRTDPRTGNGMLRAMMSAINAAHTIEWSTHDPHRRAEYLARHDTWLREWFEHDVERLLLRPTSGAFSQKKRVA